MGSRRSGAGTALLGALLAVGLAGCTSSGGGSVGTPVPLPSASSPPASPSATPTPAGPTGPVQPAGEPSDVVTGLDAPWSVVPVDGSILISQRDAANILEVTADGQTREAGRVDGVVPSGEGGLLGLTLLEEDGERWLYAYFTAQDDNRIVRMPLTGGAGSLALGAPTVVLSGLLKAVNHDGGRIAFGPDGMLYATVGDAGVRDSAQDPASLNGKILRMTPEGGVPDGNPFGDSLVWSMGHRNPQGIAWTADGVLFAAEFGQNTWDELNRIEPGANYGWPVVEGTGDDGRFVNPVYQWGTDEASPSGLAVAGDTLFLAGLGGERLWMIQGAATGGEAVATEYFGGAYGRIRDVLLAPDDSLWFLTNNTDGRGSPREGDDRLVRIALTPA
ncbi:sorbosone dehydrogenase family protein [Naasia sp. SYSU D00057]|uniref:PQQ-dependent sugar dehydrogenase n=1 Tax=Naasia sp. SYSU D00057 TaxID=2817380 RepID=UPI001B302468|nr:PQQ-dependent sugar dehydrogenase [Naasia sp. SYSU D00057]